MNLSFSKKEKRRRTSPGEANNSFFKNITSRVSGLLPTTITKWFNGGNSSHANANGSAPIADATDSSTDDEAPESPIIVQPAAKRMRFTTSSVIKNYNPREVNVSSNNDSEMYVQPPQSGTDTFKCESNIVPTPVRSNDDIYDRKEKDYMSFKFQPTVLTKGNSVAAKRKSLFDRTSSIHESKVASGKSSSSIRSDIKQPSFNPFLLGSPFYAGRTMYGGAASSSYMYKPNIKVNTVVNHKEKLNDTSAMSLSARRVLDLLEHYSSPLKEAKRIPHYARQSLHNNTSDGSPNEMVKKHYKYQELQVPRFASILRIKQTSRLTNVTSAARQIMASRSSSEQFPYLVSKKNHSDESGNEPHKMTTKMKRKLTSTRSGNIQNTEENVSAVEIPSAILQIDKNNLPKFSFGVTPLAAQISSSEPFAGTYTTAQKHNLPTMTSSLTKDDNQLTTIAGNNFEFSSPVIQTKSPGTKTATTKKSSNPSKFSFDSPDGEVVDTNNDVSFVNDIKANDSIKKDWECPDCWIKNKSDAEKCICCGAVSPRITQNKIFKCIQCKNADVEINNMKCLICIAAPYVRPHDNRTNQSLNQWKCEECWVNNDSESKQCVCCGALKPEISIASGNSNNARFEKDWKCVECWVVNKSSLNTCAACGGAKSKSDSNSPSLQGSFRKKPVGILSKKTEKSQKDDKWQCPICLVSNFSNKAICECCTTDRELLKGPYVKFNFGKNKNNIFKFGVDLKVQDNLQEKSEFTLSSENKVEHIEANNNNLSVAPSFKITLPLKKPITNLESPAMKTEEPKTTFKFGFQQQVYTESTSNVTMQNVMEESESSNFVDKNEKPQEVPSVNLLNPKLVNNNDLKNSKSVAPASSTMLQSLFKSNPEKNETVDKPHTLKPVTESKSNRDNLQTESNCTYSSGITPNSNLFKSPNEIPASVITFASPVKSDPAIAPNLMFQNPDLSNTTTSVLPMFVKSNSPITSTVSTLSKPEEVKNTDSISVPASKSTFTFGANTALNNAASDKSKFVFSFGSKKTEPPSQSMFNPVFGASAGVSSNKFVIPSGNLSNSSATVNSLGECSELATGNNEFTPNQVTSNTLVGNGFGSSNTLLGNGIKATLSENNMNATKTIPGNVLSSDNTLRGNTHNMINTTAPDVITVRNNLGGNGITTGNTVVGNNISANNTLGGNGTTKNNAPESNNSMFVNPLLRVSNTLQNATTATPIFGQPVQKENIWSVNNNSSSNLFMSNATTNPLQKPANFTFGSSAPFNTNTTPTFGNSALPSGNVFGLNQNQNMQNPPTLFSSPVQNQSATNMFGSASRVNNSAPTANMFGTSNVGVTPTFGTSNASNPPFESPSHGPTAEPAFNFGTPQSSSVFGFGQQQQQQQPAQPGVYNFGASSVSPQVQFNMGSAPVTAGRRLRKAVRRTTQR